MIDQKIVTRYAPSPTGYLHVGGLRTALYSYLYAKKLGGTFFVRIEDTDRERFVADGTKNILDSLYWAGIIPDEGVVIADDGSVTQRGANGPYIQSERLSIYRTYADQLIASGHAFYCFCSSERLDAVRTERMAAKLPPGYDGTCKHLTKEEIASKLASGTPYTIRLDMPEEGECVFTDLIRGEIRFPKKDVDDQVLIKSDGFPTYHLAVVVDDHLMEVTHVLRGEEWISSTPKHLELFAALGWDAPQYGHLPLLLNADKSKLSKRQGDVAVLDYQKKGYLPEALVNFVALLGWNPGTEQELFSLSELVAQFSLDKIHLAGAVFNLEKLDWFNRAYIKTLESNILEKYIHDFLPEPLRNDASFMTYLPRLIPTIAERIVVFSDIEKMYTEGEFAYCLGTPVFPKEKLLAKKDTDQSLVREYLGAMKDLIMAISDDTYTKETIEEKILAYANTLPARGPALHALRVALSGMDRSPDPFTLSYILGKDESLIRITHAYELLA